MKLLLIAFKCVSFVESLVTSSLDWSVRDGQVVDFHGRQRFFHGVNVVYKSAPYIPNTEEYGPLSFNDQDAKLLQQLGMNAVRLGVMWGGVEPIEGKYNQSYTDALKNIVRTCEQFDIQVLLDFHQDSLCEVFCGEGIPWWAAYNYGPASRSFPSPVDKPFEMLSVSNFSGSFNGALVPSYNDCSKHNYNVYMASYAMIRNYEDIYLNGRGLRDKFVNFWRYLAEQFRDHTNIIGFELMNEPASVRPRNFSDSYFLQPLYDILAEAIHEIDPGRILFFEPVTWDRGYEDSTRPYYDTGLSHAPGGQQFRNRSVFAYHYYDFERKYNADPFFQSRIQTAQRLQVASFVTEFELEHVKSEGDISNDHLGYALDIMDTYLQSWLAWTYKGFYPVGYLAPEKIPFVATCTGCGSGLFPNLPQDTMISWPTAKVLARTYAQAVQGRTLKMQFDSKTSIFRLLYEFDPQVEGPTLIYVNMHLGGSLASRYASGVNVTVTDGFAWALDGTALTVTARKAMDKREVSVTVAPAKTYYQTLYA